jgi:hypothetical protein
MKTLCDGGGIHEVASAQAANNVLIEIFDLYSDLLLRTHPLLPIIHPSPPPHPTLRCAPSQLGSPLFHQTPPSSPEGTVRRGLTPGGWHSPSAQQRAPRTAGTPFTRTRLTLLSQGRLHDVGCTMRRRSSPKFGNSTTIAHAYQTPCLCAGALGTWPATACPLALPSSHR